MGSVRLGPSCRPLARICRCSFLCLISQEINKQCICVTSSIDLYWIDTKGILPEPRKHIGQVKQLQWIFSDLIHFLQYVRWSSFLTSPPESNQFLLWISKPFGPFTLHTEHNIYVDSSRNRGGCVVFISLCGSPSAVSTTWNTKASDSNQDEGKNAWKQTLLFGAQASWLLSNARCSKSSNVLQVQMLQS